MNASRSAHKNETLVILDAHAILHRAYHALPDFSSSNGQPTGALYGVVAMLIRIIQELDPDHIVACYDLPEPTFRHEAYADYKAGRPEADPALVEQIKRSREIFEAFHISVYEAAGFEADDVIGTITETYRGTEGIDMIIASGDMDTLQLVDDDRIKVYTLRKGVQDAVMYDEAAVKERFGFAPHLLPDYKGLRGDPSDNIIGISGIGDKTATMLVSTFGTIEEIYDTLARKGSDPFIEAGLKERIVRLLREGEEEAAFSKTLATIRRDAPISFTLPDEKWEDGFDVTRAIQMCERFEFRSLRTRLQETFAGVGQEKTGEDAETGEEASGGEVSDEEFTRMQIALWLLNSDLTAPTRDDIASYAGTQNMQRAKEVLGSRIKDSDLTYVYEHIELPLAPILRRAEERGIKVDREHLEHLSEEYHAELTRIEGRIWEHAGREFNINSPKQLAEVLYDELGLSTKGLKKTSGGARSTRESELQKLKDHHPIIADILKYRELQKLLSTYIDAIPKMVAPDGRLHARLDQTGTATGRLSSRDPNMQNIPVREGLGGAIRNAFVATEGHILMAFDYSQIEIRVLADMSGDERLQKVFAEGGDVHTTVAAYMYHVPEAEVTKDMRRKAKVVNFGIIYGMGVNALKQNLGTTQKEAQEFYNRYFESFPGVTRFIEDTKAEARTRGYTTTRFGRRRFFEGMRSNVPYIRAAAERMAVNAPIQGTEADIMKLAIVQADAALREAELIDRVHLLLTVHDELIYEVAGEATEEARTCITPAMEEIPRMNVPLVVDVAAGDTWGGMQPVAGARA